MVEDELVITVERCGHFGETSGLDAGVRRNIEAFFLSLGRELEFLRTRPEDVERAEVLLLARLDGVLAGMIGVVRRFRGVPCTFVVVKKEYQRRGIARVLYEARRPYCRRYNVVFSIVLAGNRSGRDFFAKAGEKKLVENGRYIVFVTSQKRVIRCLYPLFRLLLLPLLKRRCATEIQGQSVTKG
jgi:GNAT superfamily N-acetyltransferase